MSREVVTALDSEPLRAGGRAKYMFFFGKLLFSQVSTRQEDSGLSVFFARARERLSRTSDYELT